MTNEINARIQNGNRCWFALQNIMRSKNISWCKDKNLPHLNQNYYDVYQRDLEYTRVSYPNRQKYSKDLILSSWFSRRDSDGHVARQENDRIAVGKRPLGRPRLRWRDKVSADLQILNIVNPERIMMDRQQWRQIATSAKIHPGLWRLQRERE